MALNDAGTSKYDNQGTASATLLTALNDIGTSKYDNQGTAAGFIGVSGGVIVNTTNFFFNWA